MRLSLYFFLSSMKSFVSEDFNMFCYIKVNIITQMHTSMNYLKDPWMLMLFGDHPSIEQQNWWTVGFEPTLSHKNQNLSLAP